MTKEEYEIAEGIAKLTDVNKAYFLAILRSLSFAQEYGEKNDADSNKENISKRST